MTLDRRAYHLLILGGTGSGKTFLAREILREYAKKPDYLVIVNTTKQLQEFARHREVVSMDDLDRDWTPEELVLLIRRHGAVHFEVSPGAEPKRIQAWMNALGHACMSLGKLETDRCHVLLVVDECHTYLSEKTYSRGMRRVHSEGRKYGVDTMQITQQLAGSGGELIAMSARRMVNVLIVCPMDEMAERKRVMEAWRELPDPGELAFPIPATKTPGEYMVRDRGSRSACLVRVRNGRRYVEPLMGVGGPAPPKR